MAGRMGGPLLCVADLLADLSSSDDEVDGHSVSDSSHSQLPSTSLHAAFEKNFNDLTRALANSGHSWTGLTQKVCTTLKVADKLVQTAHSELEGLSEKVQKLETILHRENIVISELRTSKKHDI
eukprot:TRINITY_DN7141_c0_g1_i1.p1 TRINITY_DN7141_c0_g1~~TRINITY_DN7141_c0_g1_i1.p1  ORF type:complete len:124 (-),score=21.32 TRINITY_DN7141_c0_g1_i1:296-667(-)